MSNTHVSESIIAKPDLYFPVDFSELHGSGYRVRGINEKPANAARLDRSDRDTYPW